MAERPVIFSGESVRAILAGKKTQTRRVVKPQPVAPRWQTVVVAGVGGWVNEHGRALRNPYGGVGDRLWVRETWFEVYDRDTMKPTGKALYAATQEGEVLQMDEDGGIKTTKSGWDASPWKSPMFMPRWASRLTLQVTDVRVEPLQSISEEDAKAEGHGMTWGGGCRHRSFAGGWDALNAKRGFGWLTNPWVWVVSFRRVEVPGV